MFKLLIVDDEPLVQVGVKSMVNWGDVETEVIGCASNGQQALEIIERDMPDIVITDIKMPIMDGLELAKYCKENMKDSPVFIVLTSFEEFELAKKAIKYNVVDYLIKLELNSDMLKESVKKAIDKVKEKNAEKGVSAEHYDEVSFTQSFEEKFFIKLLYNLFENEEQFKMQLHDVQMDLSGERYLTCFCEICSEYEKTSADDQVLNRYMYTLNMFKEIAGKYLRCYVLSLDYKHFAVVCCFKESQSSKINEDVALYLKKICVMIYKYYNVKIKIGVGKVCEKLEGISLSFEEAKYCYNSSDNEDDIVFYSEYKKSDDSKDGFNLSLYKDEFIKAFEEYNVDALHDIFSKVIDNLNHNCDKYLQALDCACDILYICINLISDGEDCINDIFSKEVDGYKSIYQKKNVEQIIRWVAVFRDRLCSYMEEKKKNYTNVTISRVKKYINEHLNEKLSLNEISAIYNISPSYLSTLFKKYCNIGFSEYITHTKINKARELLVQENYKVYEVSDMLGFESAFYFSKVFKKVTGYSPKEYTQKQA